METRDRNRSGKGMKIKFKRIHPDAVAPIRATDGAAGWDLTAIQTEFDTRIVNKEACFSESVVYHTGLSVEIPKGYIGLLFARSSCWKQGMILANCVGVIDPDYRGEIKARFWYKQDYPGYTDGDRVAQLVIVPALEIDFEESDTLSETKRGDGGFGSTGK